MKKLGMSNAQHPILNDREAYFREVRPEGPPQFK